MLSPFERAKKSYFKQMEEIETIVSELGEDNKKALQEIKVKYDDYLSYSDYLLSLIEKDSLDMFREELKKDKGYELWMIFEKNSLKISNYLNDQNEDAKAEYELANQRIFILQVILAFIGFPTLIFMIIKIRKDKVKRQQLFVKLEKITESMCLIRARQSRWVMKIKW
jgi:CHASE3 domain sensor protein